MSETESLIDTYKTECDTQKLAQMSFILKDIQFFISDQNHRTQYNGKKIMFQCLFNLSAKKCRDPLQIETS